MYPAPPGPPVHDLLEHRDAQIRILEAKVARLRAGLLDVEEFCGHRIAANRGISVVGVMALAELAREAIDAADAQDDPMREAGR